MRKKNGGYGQKRSTGFYVVAVDWSLLRAYIRPVDKLGKPVDTLKANGQPVYKNGRQV